MNLVIVFVEAQSIHFKNRYMSPEMIQKEGHNFSVDFYGLGALLYEMVLEFPLFTHRILIECLTIF